MSFEKQKILILGSGPYCIGSSVEFDWCGVQVLRTLRKMGHETLFLNANPETVSTDFDECDKLFFDALTPERVRDICDQEQPDGVIFSTGGQVPQNMIFELSDAGVPLLGTSVESIRLCEDRELFSKLCDELEIDQPRWARFEDLSEVFAFADRVGYPVLVRPSFVLSGAAMAVATDGKGLETYLEAATVQNGHAVVVSKFEEDAKEIEFDGVAKGGRMICSAISEHIENAGVHSGDATIACPPQNVNLATLRRIRRTAQKLCGRLNITGPFNIQFLAKRNEIKIIECNLRASRTFPFVSKVLNQNFLEIATRIWMGEAIPPQEKNLLEIDHVGVKAAQFSFSRLKNADPNLGVEMSSTGEVACFGESVQEALLKSMISVGVQLPSPGSSILLSLGKLKEKVDFLPYARMLTELGFSLFATENTARYFEEQGVVCEQVYKISSGKHPNVMDLIDQKQVELVINTPQKFSHEEVTDGYLIRRKTVDRNIPLLVNLQLAKLFVQSIKHLPTEDHLSIYPYQYYRERANA